jgi:hypothetical protein
MPYTIITALIAGSISLIVSVITYVTTKRQMALEREKLERQLKRKFTERLYDLRLQHYAKAFEITENLGKGELTATAGLQSQHIAIRDQLKNWKSGEVNLIISDKALEEFYELLRALKKNPEKGTVYSNTQIDNLWRARNKLRGALRFDLGLLFQEDREVQS